MKETLCWARSSARLKGFIPSLLTSTHCSPPLLWLRKVASIFTNPWRPLLCHISVPSLWQLNSQGKEPPAKFSAHLSYTHKQTISQEEEEKKTEESFYGLTWEESVLSLFRKGMGNIGFCFVLWPTFRTSTKYCIKQRASSDFQIIHHPSASFCLLPGPWPNEEANIQDHTDPLTSDLNATQIQSSL